MFFIYLRPVLLPTNSMIGDLYILNLYCVLGAAQRPQGPPLSGAVCGRTEPQQDPVSPRTRLHRPDTLCQQGLWVWFLWLFEIHLIQFIL